MSKPAGTNADPGHSEESAGKSSKILLGKYKKPKPGAREGITAEHLPKGAYVESKKGHEGIVVSNDMAG